MANARTYNRESLRETQALLLAVLELGYLRRAGWRDGRQVTKITAKGKAAAVEGKFPDDWDALTDRLLATRSDDELNQELNGKRH